ncbi:MAG: N4-gp56 family major capsid protein [Christensenellaceae bacterium]|jgi:N4-gp56 family major capsid protein|nr:N4-gp56 family major capsid protein [Christensenellaceae bacterium]
MPVNNSQTLGLHSTLQNYYDGKLLLEMEKRLVYYQNGQRKALPEHNGRTVEFWRYAPFAPITTALSEGVVPDGQTLAMEKVIASVETYGGYVSTTDVLTLSGVNTETNYLVDLMAKQGALTLDHLVRDVISGGSAAIYAGGKAGRAEVGQSAVLTIQDIRKAVRRLEKLGAPKFNRGGMGYYKAIIGPDAKYSLQSDPLWEDKASYQQAEQIENGELGKLFGVIFIESTEAKVFSGVGNAGADLGATVVFGEDAYGVVDLGTVGDTPVRTIIKPLGSAGSSDPLDQIATVGWKVNGFTSVILNENWLVRIEHGIEA